VTVSGTGSLILTWSASTDNVGVAGYRIERCQGNSCTNFVQIATSTGTRFVNSGLTAKTTYRYRVRANDAAGNVSGYSSISTGTTAATTGPDKSPPTAPASLSATAIGSTAIQLAWAPSTDNVGVYAYKVERCQGATCTNFAQIATPTSTSYTVNYLTAGTTYRYRVRATDVAGNKSDYSPIAAASTGGGADASPPTVPSALTATASGAGSVNLTWSASTDNVGVTAYRIERCQGATCTNYAQIATSTSTSFSSTGLAAGTTYRYRVRASDAAGNLGGYSNVASATTASADALMAGLAFNEGTGTNAADEATGGHTGTLVNGPTWVTGRFGKGLSFDGVNDWVTLGNPGTLNFASDFTIAVWVKRNALGGSGQRHILAKCGNTWTNGCKELYFAGDTLRFGSYGTGDTNSITIADTSWHHVAVTFTRSTNTIRIYVDGTLRTTAVRNLESDGSSHAVTVGNMRGNNPFSGIIDEVRVFSQALNATQITAAMTTPL
jgi:chitodextrinase